MGWKPQKRQHLKIGLGAVAVALLTTGCIGQNIQNIGRFNGGIIADEPRAALMGREVLAAGGSAADAVVAAYFAMAVTYPSGAGLGGGGQCVVHSFGLKQTEALLFHAVAPLGGDGRVAVPANARGMFALHARYGLAEWAELLLPAEALARDGHPVSRAFARQLQTYGGALAADVGARELFFDASGQPLSEGQVLRQVELGALISVIRTRGPGDFYAGQAGQRFAEASQQAGVPITGTDLRRTRPEFQPTIQIPIGDHLLHFAPTAGSAVAGHLWALLDHRDSLADAARSEQAHLLSELGRAARRVAAADLADLPTLTDERQLDRVLANYNPAAVTVASDPQVTEVTTGGASIVATDRFGETVACAFTMNRPFGSGRMAPGTGVLIAAAPPSLNDAMAVAIMSNPAVHEVYFAGAAAAGPTAPFALVESAWPVLNDEGDLAAAVAAPRFGPSPRPAVVRYEEGLRDDVLRGLLERGHQTLPISSYGLVAALYCPDGLPRELDCAFAHDPRGFGLAAVTDQ